MKGIPLSHKSTQMVSIYTGKQSCSSMITRLLITFSVFLLLSCTLVSAEPLDELFEEGSKYVHASLISDHATLQPQKSSKISAAQIGILLRIEAGWHIYWRNSGEAAFPTTVSWKLPSGWTVGKLRWPLPYRFIERGNITTFGYRREVLLFADLFSPTVEPNDNESVLIEAEVKWLACKDVCIPGKARLTKEIPFSITKALQASPEAKIFDVYRALTPAKKETEKKTVSKSGIRLSPILSKNSTKPKETLSFLVLLEGLALSENASEKLQFFPHEHDHFSFGSPELAKLDSRKIPVEKDSFLIRVPLRVSADASVGTHTLSGVLAISDAVGKTKGVQSASWNASLEVGSESSENQNHNGMLEAAETFSPLTYRRLSYKDLAKEHSTAKTAPVSTNPQTSSSSNLLLSLLFAFIGGMLLNLMPCVLPIISIKVMGFVESAEQPRARTVASALAFSAGIICSFLALAGIVITLRLLGYQLGWGFQFQYPEFVLALILIVYVLSLGFFDVYSISLPFLQQANRSVTHLSPGLAKHFFDGILATALSTPCTAPFLGTALVYAFTQPPVITLMIFLAIGVGLALPYAYLSTHPKVLKFLPAPGAWMYRLRELMGFLLLATVIWLLFVLHRLTEEGVVWTLGLMLLLYFALWLQSWAKESTKKKRALVSILISCVLLAGYLILAFPLMVERKNSFQVSKSGIIPWEAFSEELLSQAKASNTGVFIDFTADWCLTCKANEFLIIETEKIKKSLEEHKIMPLKADWTTGNPKITEALKRFGGSGVPLYVVIPANPAQPPIVLPTLPSSESLIEAFKQASIKDL